MTNAQKWVVIFLVLFVFLLVLVRITKEEKIDNFPNTEETSTIDLSKQEISDTMKNE